MSSRQFASIQPTAVHSLLASAINEHDIAENVVEWIKSGDFTPKLFLKHLPHTARDISLGLLEEEDVSLWLMACYIWNDENDDTTRLRALSSALATLFLPPTPSPSHRMKAEAMMASFLYYKYYRRDMKGSVIHVTSSLVDAIKSIRSCVLEDDDEWADKVKESIGLSNRRVTPVHKLSETQFVDAVHGELAGVNAAELWRECEMMRRAMNALVRVTANYHPIFYTCWECNQVDLNVSHCGRCEAALYCSRKCQVAAWKGGHKRKCARLKMLQEGYLSNVEEVERAHVTGMLDGFELSPQTDCQVMATSFAAQVNPGNDRMQSSMKSYYENLGRIIRGEWWVFDLSDDDKCPDDSAIDSCHPDVVVVQQQLTMDWFEYARITLGVVSVDPQQVTALTDPYLRRRCSAPMSVDALLKVMHVVDPRMPYRHTFKVVANNNIRTMHDQVME